MTRNYRETKRSWQGHSRHSNKIVIGIGQLVLNSDHQTLVFGESYNIL